MQIGTQNQFLINFKQFLKLILLRSVFVLKKLVPIYKYKSLNMSLSFVLQFPILKNMLIHQTMF